MRKTVRWSWAVAAVSACVAGAAFAASEPTGVRPSFRQDLGDADGRMAAYLCALGDFRNAAVEKASAVVARQFVPAAQTKWNADVAAEMDDRLLADFFRGAIAMTGPQTPDGGIGGLYNPWWDALLVMRLKPKENGPEASFAVTEFHFLSGETFRGEPVERDPKEISCRTVVPEGDPLSVELWRVVAATRRKFEQAFPMDGKVGWGGFASKLLALDRVREHQRIVARAALRLKLRQTILRDPAALGKSKVFENLVRTGNHYQLFTYFRDPNCFGVMRTLSELPAVFRQDFTLYGYVPTTEGAQYLYVNAKVPRLYATIAVPKDVGKRPASLEWFDLAQADDLLRVWNARDDKEAK
ncbi:MAG: hypothetical protein ACI4RD_08360 [Kiritimatiellia bacterium]